MPLPTPTSVYIDRPLTNMSIAYNQDPKVAGFARRMFPVVQVPEKTGKYFTFPKAAWFRNEMQLRTPGAKPAEIGFTVSNDSFSCDQYGVAHVMPDEIKKSFQAQPDADFYASGLLSMKAMIRENVSFASEFMTTSVWSTDITGVSSGENDSTTIRQWNDSASDPIKWLKAAMRAVHKAIGRKANKIGMGAEVWDALSIHPDMVGSLPDSSPKIFTEADFEKMFGLPAGGLVVMDAVYNTAAEGQTASMSYVAGKHCLVCYASPSPAIAEPSAGYIMHYDEFGVGVAKDGAVAIERHRRDEEHADVFQAFTSFDLKATATDAGYFFSSIVA